MARIVARFTQVSKPEPDTLVSDPLFASAQAILESQGEANLIRRLRASWPHMDQRVRQEMAEGRGFRFWLQDG